jgi:hypothetical protein
MPESGHPPIGRLLGWALVGSLCVAAATAIVALAGGSFDDTDWKVIGTSLSFAAYSALASSGASVRVKEHPAAPALGVATIAAASLGWALLLAEIWIDFDDETIVRACAVVTIAALAGSHASLVLRGTRAGDTAVISALVVASIALGVLDGTAGAVAIAANLDVTDAGERLMAVALVLLLLTTALPPVLRRMQPARPAPDWPEPRDGSLERLAGAVVASTERIERLDDPAAVRAECRRLRELARSLGG